MCVRTKMHERLSGEISQQIYIDKYRLRFQTWKANAQIYMREHVRVENKKQPKEKKLKAKKAMYS